VPQSGARMVLTSCPQAIPDASCLNTLNSFDSWSAVPIDGSATYDQIANHVSLPWDVVYRIIQHAITMRIFTEVKPDVDQPVRVKHTSRSAAAAHSAGLQALMSSILDDSGPPMMVLNEALRRYSAGKPKPSQDMSETSFALFHAGGQFGNFQNSWERLENDGKGAKQGWRQRNFVELMKCLKELFHLEDVVLNSYDWPAEGRFTVVDVSGLSCVRPLLLGPRALT
jgi:hypothetical protein